MPSDEQNEAPDLKAVHVRHLIKELRRREVHTRGLGAEDIPDDVLMRELLGRTEAGFILATFTNADGERQPRYRCWGDPAVVNAHLNSACRYLNRTLDGQWEKKETWE